MKSRQTEVTKLTEAQNQQFIQSITDAMPGMVSYWDADLCCHFANHAYLEWFGKPPEAILGTYLPDLLGERIFKLDEPHVIRVLAGEKQQFESTLTKPDGTVGYHLVNFIPDVDEHGTVAGFFVQVSDVTRLKEAEAKLELAASVYQNVSEGITVTDMHGVILAVNPAFTRITGFSAQEAIGQTPRILKSNRHDQAFYVAMWQEISSHGRWKGDVWNRRKDGEVYLERMTISMIRNAAGEPSRYVSVFNDITELWHKDEYIRHLAFYDALTDLPNRSLLMERLFHHISIARREKSGIALLFLDLDKFKFINDQFGHELGDNVLKLTAQRLLTLVRQSDTVARLGGDEFVILLASPANNDEVTHIANRIVASINEPMELSGKRIQVGTSIGIARFPDDGDTHDALIKNADAAMYAAKNTGNTFRFFGSIAPTRED